jgi:hypothetical protein
VTAVVLAHQGGWDELLLVAGPILVFAGLLAVASRRAKRLEAEQEQAEQQAGQE